jgi:hypothetical protein
MVASQKIATDREMPTTACSSARQWWWVKMVISEPAQRSIRDVLKKGLDIGSAMREERKHCKY